MPWWFLGKSPFLGPLHIRPIDRSITEGTYFFFVDEKIYPYRSQINQWGERRGKTIGMIDHLNSPVFLSTAGVLQLWQDALALWVQAAHLRPEFFMENLLIKLGTVLGSYFFYNDKGFETGPLLCLPVTQSSLGRLLASFPLVENLFKLQIFTSAWGLDMLNCAHGVTLAVSMENDIVVLQIAAGGPSGNSKMSRS